MEDFERFVLLATGVSLRVEHGFHPDGLPPIRDYTGPQLVAFAYCNRLVSMTDAGRDVRELPESAIAALVAALERAREERVTSGADTADGRPMTTYAIDLEHPRGPEHSFALRGAVNHYGPDTLPGAWSSALRLLRDIVGPVRGALADAWDVAMRWSGPIDLGPVWTAGGVVRTPHVVTTILHDADFYVRVGQPPAASHLYHVRPDTPHHWLLPCGGGAIRREQEWQQPPRYVLRVDDATRWMYVQRA